MELEFLKLKFPISGRFLNILETVLDCKIFLKIVVFGHFGLHLHNNLLDEQREI